MRKGRILDSLDDRILEMILYVKFRRPIGRKSKKVTGDGILGKRARK